LGDLVYLVSVSTAGDISVFNVTNEIKREFKGEEARTLAAVVERKMEVRITQLDVSSILPNEIKQTKTEKKIKKALDQPKKKFMNKEKKELNQRRKGNQEKTKKIKKKLNKRKKTKKVRIVVKSKK
jgi:hypothetical protein